ncbi:MAG: 3D domain-containing protein [Candidatus Heimdallarchaeaceae archaeon]
MNKFKFSWQKRRALISVVKTFVIYIMLVALTISICLNYLGISGKFSLARLSDNKTKSFDSQKIKETIRDVRIKYVKREIPYYFDNEGNKWREFTVTAYTANDPTYPQGTNNIVAAGFDVNKPYMSKLPIAASNCIPLYSVVEIEGMGAFIILDRGLGYKTEDGWEDENWIDILFKDKEKAFKFGKQRLKVRVINEGVIFKEEEEK